MEFYDKDRALLSSYMAEIESIDMPATETAVGSQITTELAEKVAELGYWLMTTISDRL